MTRLCEKISIKTWFEKISKKRVKRDWEETRWDSSAIISTVLRFVQYNITVLQANQETVTPNLAGWKILQFHSIDEKNVLYSTARPLFSSFFKYLFANWEKYTTIAMLAPKRRLHVYHITKRPPMWRLLYGFEIIHE